jgi:peptidoglycan/LPS O-acetylase OafA/YrhL
LDGERGSADRRASVQALFGAFALWIVAALLAAAGAALVGLAGVCESSCPSTAEQLATGAIPIAASSVPLYFAAVLLFRSRGLQHASARAVRAAAGLTVYTLGAVALAWWFADDAVIQGNGPWAAFWVLAVAGWIGLGALAARRP